MPLFLADTAYFAAIINERHDLHARAVRAAQALVRRPRVHLITSTLVLSELLAIMSRMGPQVRAAAGLYVKRPRGDPTVTIVEVSLELFDPAVDLYLQRPDKRYSVTGRASMLICRHHRITGVLTSDHDFEQEGFTILLG